MKLFINIISYILPYLLIYLGLSYIELNFNILNWNIYIRIIFVILIYSLFILSLLIYYKNNKLNALNKENFKLEVNNEVDLNHPFTEDDYKKVMSNLINKDIL